MQSPKLLLPVYELRQGSSVVAQNPIVNLPAFCARVKEAMSRFDRDGTFRALIFWAVWRQVCRQESLTCRNVGYWPKWC